MRFLRIAAMLLLPITATLAIAEPAQAKFENKKGRFQVGGGLGFSVDSLSDGAAFLLSFQGSYFLTDNISITPSFSLFVPRSSVAINPVVDGRYMFDIDSADLNGLKPFVGIGMGAFIWIPNGGNAVGAFDIHIPFGIDYFLTEQFSIGTEMAFDVIVHEFGGDFLWRWQLITARYAF